MPIVFEQPGPFSQDISNAYGRALAYQQNPGPGAAGGHAGGSGAGLDAGGGGGGGGGASAASVYTNRDQGLAQDRMTEGEQRFAQQMSMQANQLSWGEQLRLQRLQQGMDYVNNRDDLSEDEKNDYRMELQTQIKPYQRRQVLSQMQHQAAQTQLLEEQAQREAAKRKADETYDITNQPLGVHVHPVIRQNAIDQLISEGAQWNAEGPDDWEAKVQQRTHELGGIAVSAQHGPSGSRQPVRFPFEEPTFARGAALTPQVRHAIGLASTRQVDHEIEQSSRPGGNGQPWWMPPAPPNETPAQKLERHRAARNREIARRNAEEIGRRGGSGGAVPGGPAPVPFDQLMQQLRGGGATNGDVGGGEQAPLQGRDINFSGTPQQQRQNQRLRQGTDWPEPQIGDGAPSI